MSVFIPVVPFGIEQSIRELGLVPQHVVLSPSSILQHAKAYQQMYTGKGVRRPQTIIVNGGLGDGTKALSVPMLKTAALQVKATHLVLPDMAHNEAKTLKAASKALAELEGMDDRPLAIGVPQGESFEEYINCANELVDMGVDALGVSVGIHEVSRLRASYVMSMCSLHVPVHIFGFTDDMDEDIYCAQLPRVASLSSAMPVWLGQQGTLFRNPWPRDSKPYGRRPADFFQQTGVTSETLANIFIVESWMKRS